jgi:hypothetical protein
MNFITGATLRRIWPALAVTTLLGISLLAPSAPLGAIASVGYGNNGNNCGVKGYGYHDHGKPCPNRPFPGKGKGVTEILSGTSPSSQTTADNSTETSEGDDDATTLSVSATSGSEELTQSNSKGHHGKGRGHSKVGG